MKMSPLHNRAAILLFFLFLWAALVAAHLFYYSILEADKYIERGNAIAYTEGVIPATIGTIKDSKGCALAWTEQRIDICLDTVPEIPFRRKRVEDAIHEYFPEFILPEDNRKIYLKKDISPLEQLKLYPLTEHFPEIIFISRYQRCYIDETIKAALQKIEFTHRDIILGRNGIYTVMRDKNRKWIPGTWEEKMPPVNGRDIKLKLTYEELLKKNNYEQ